MKSSRSALFAVVLSGALAVTAACGDKKDDSAATPGAAAPATSAAAPSPTADAKAELTAAFKKLAAVSMTYTASTDTAGAGGTKITGAADPNAKATSATMVITAAGQTINAQMLVVNTDMYLKMDLPLPGVDAKKWMYIDGSKTSLSKLGLGSPDDPANIKNFTDAVVTAEKTGATSFKGTFDATKRNIPAVGAQLIQSMGDAAKAIPFEATVGADGYLTGLTVKMPAAGQIPATTSTQTFSDFGKPVTIKKPAAGETQPAPAALLAQFA
ncbi:hypothetical protein Dvina_24950 [Dactylosporangium vinaceum]|uniref:Lipoprotein n=1 Tax=Dactylosporangium vinaceum TaxID=53362 RepID=A0ABV5MEI0_9ACTN|nr:hypothetical protein [Dactylosporangium vinaceum]UAC01012.1 hypothetical protein Dvina_24950 [Dactylosporangium vinaceum]